MTKAKKPGFPFSGVVAWLPESSLRGGIYADVAIKYKHIFILNLFSILIKSLITFGIAWIAAATSWLRNDEFFINFRAMQQRPVFTGMTSKTEITSKYNINLMLINYDSNFKFL